MVFFSGKSKMNERRKPMRGEGLVASFAGVASCGLPPEVAGDGGREIKRKDWPQESAKDAKKVRNTGIKLPKSNGRWRKAAFGGRTWKMGDGIYGVEGRESRGERDGSGGASVFLFHIESFLQYLSGIGKKFISHS